MAEDAIEVEVSGLKLSIDRAVFADDMETLELLADADDGNPMALPRLLRHVFGDEQYGRVKDALRVDGRVALSDMSDFMAKTFEAVGETAKN